MSRERPLCSSAMADRCPSCLPPCAHSSRTAIRARTCPPSLSAWPGKDCCAMPPTPSPLAPLLEVTYRCPLRCPYCSNPLELDRYRQELDTATWQRVLTEAAQLG